MFIALKIIAIIVFFLIGIQPTNSQLQVGLLSAMIGVLLVGQWQNNSQIKKIREELDDNENEETNHHSK